MTDNIAFKTDTPKDRSVPQPHPNAVRQTGPNVLDKPGAPKNIQETVDPANSNTGGDMRGCHDPASGDQVLNDAVLSGSHLPCKPDPDKDGD